MSDQVTDHLIKIGPLWWPQTDVSARLIIQSEVGPAMAWALSHVPNRSCVIQAGGNVGVYPLKLASVFNRIHTFEPDQENFDCLWLNVQDNLTIDPWLAALGDQPGNCKSMVVEAGNCGAHRIIPGTEVPIMMIDSLQASPDLIWLDIEGYEFMALQGAQRTIEDHRPVIITEEKGLGRLYGIPDEAIGEFLADLGYACVSTHLNDRLYEVLP